MGARARISECVWTGGCGRKQNHRTLETCSFVDARQEAATCAFASLWPAKRPVLEGTASDSAGRVRHAVLRGLAATTSVLRCTAEANEVAMLGDSEADILAGACACFTGAGYGRPGLAGHCGAWRIKFESSFFSLALPGSKPKGTILVAVVQWTTTSLVYDNHASWGL